MDKQIVLDMTPTGEFHKPPRLPLSVRVLGIAVAVAAIAMALAVGALALWFALILIPVALAAATVAWLAWRYRLWRAKAGFARAGMTPKAGITPRG